MKQPETKAAEVVKLANAQIRVRQTLESGLSQHAAALAAADPVRGRAQEILVEAHDAGLVQAEGSLQLGLDLHAAPPLPEEAEQAAAAANT